MTTVLREQLPAITYITQIRGGGFFTPLLLVVVFAILSFLSSVLQAAPVPYAGKVSINGVNFDGAAQMNFALRDANGTVH